MSVRIAYKGVFTRPPTKDYSSGRGIVLLLCLLTFFSVAASASPAVAPVNLNISGNPHFALQKAIEFDLTRQPGQARKIYDDLLDDQNVLPGLAVASAVNLYALGMDDEAMKAFKSIQNSANKRDSEYSSLWVLLLTARTGSKDVQKKLAEMVSGLSFASINEKYIADMFAGELSVTDALDKISTLHFSSQYQKSDVLTSSVFFASNYLLYVRGDQKGARDLIEKRKREFLFESLERPLME
ncbi:hypothetical protein [Citrobacter amalonaticus]|uniref:hypothetical protein n=1 Tax=Citrobacter amalonaticus TaxID=35703 RepID=UPI001A347AC4|nr:hypothetical protein [Citrobacter amalonaticus]HDQ2813325.1 hypothetical protein [Citrobacter amalonaticus]